MMKRTIRWSILMAILGFILGLGFLIPIPTNELRKPASDRAETAAPPPFLALTLDLGRDTESRSEEELRKLETPFTLPTTTADRRKDVLFDIHTVSRSRFAKDTDAYVVAWFRGGSTRDEISGFTYCHNYDYETNHARTELSRYATQQDDPSKKFPCYAVSIDGLEKGTTLINSIFGPLLTLKTDRAFDPRKGGTLSIIFAYHVAKIGKNDYRSAHLKIRLKNGKLTATGPDNEYFDWLNLIMSEDLLGLPNGVNSFGFFAKGIAVSNYKGKSFSKMLRPAEEQP